MQTSDLVQRVHVCANTFRHQHSSIIKNSQIYIYIYQYFQDRCKLCPHCYQMSNPPKYRSLIPAVWVWKYGTGSVILPVKICQVPEQKNMGLSENRGFPQNPMVHHGLSISKIKTLGEFSTHFHPFSSIFITMVIFWGILKKKNANVWMTNDDQISWEDTPWDRHLHQRLHQARRCRCQRLGQLLRSAHALRGVTGGSPRRRTVRPELPPAVIWRNVGIQCKACVNPW